MADFHGIFMWVLRIEDSQLKGETVDLEDGQGLTRLGVGQKSNPEVPAIFYTMPLSGAIGIAETVYRGKYWNRFQGDRIADDAPASCLLSFAINDGDSREIKMCQSVVGVPVDGVFGAQTLLAVNSREPLALAAALRAAQTRYYDQLFAGNPGKYGRFINGWRHRANLVYPSLV